MHRPRPRTTHRHRPRPAAARHRHAALPAALRRPARRRARGAGGAVRRRHRPPRAGRPGPGRAGALWHVITAGTPSSNATASRSGCWAGATRGPSTRCSTSCARPSPWWRSRPSPCSPCSDRQFFAIPDDHPVLAGRLVARSAISADRLALPVFNALAHLADDLRAPEGVRRAGTIEPFPVTPAGGVSNVPEEIPLMRTLAGWCVRHRRIVVLLWFARLGAVDLHGRGRRHRLLEQLQLPPHPVLRRHQPAEVRRALPLGRHRAGRLRHLR